MWFPPSWTLREVPVDAAYTSVAGVGACDNSAMISLREVIALPGLGLSAMGSAGDLSAEVRWAHVSELRDPSPWLLGGELLLTTGMNLETSEEACLEYCARLVNAGVAALGLSTGRSLPHPSMPAPLVAAAEKAGLALVHVPEDTLLQTIVQRVSDALHEERSAPLLRALAAQRELSEAAAGHDGLVGVIKRLSKTSGFTSVIYDDRLRVITSTSHETEERLAPLKDELRGRLLQGLRWSMTTGDGVESVVALPLGTEGSLRGILVVSKASTVSTYDRAALAMVVSLLSVLLELRHAQNAHQRALHSHALDAILNPEAAPQEVAARLRDAGVSARSFRVLAISSTTHLERVTALVAGLSAHAEDVLVREGAEETILVICDPSKSLPKALLNLVHDAKCGPAGAGEVTDVDGIRSSLKQARFARAAAQARGVEFLDRSDVGGYRGLIQMGDATQREAFTESVLGVLDDHDRVSGQHLVDTLSAFVKSGSSIETTAELLGVHRHTIRARLQRIRELTHRDLNHPPDLFELWLAVELREVG